jgi:DNA-binding transcriptional LysR family regulator
MQKVHNLDLKLLQLFDHVYRQRNLSKVAAQLNLTQPAVSLALGRLRRHFADPLFLRVGSAMEATPVAEQLHPLVTHAAALLEALLEFQPSFDPVRDARTFRTAMTDVGQIVILPRLLNTLASVAPQVKVEVSQVAADTADNLQRGALDLALGFLPEAEGRFVQQPLFLETFSCLVRRGHPRVGEALSARQYQDEQHVDVETSGTGHLIVERQLSRLGLHRRISVRIPNFIGLAAVIGSTDLIATLPTRAAQLLEPGSNTRVLPLPVAMPGYQVRQQWHERMQRDPGHSWLRNLIAALFRQDPTADRPGLTPGTS